MNCKLLPKISEAEDLGAKWRRKWHPRRSSAPGQTAQGALQSIYLMSVLHRGLRKECGWAGASVERVAGAGLQRIPAAQDRSLVCISGGATVTCHSWTKKNAISKNLFCWKRAEQTWCSFRHARTCDAEFSRRKKETPLYRIKRLLAKLFKLIEQEEKSTHT